MSFLTNNSESKLFHKMIVLLSQFPQNLLIPFTILFDNSAKQATTPSSEPNLNDLHTEKTGLALVLPRYVRTSNRCVPGNIFVGFCFALQLLSCAGEGGGTYCSRYNTSLGVYFNRP